MKFSLFLSILCLLVSVWRETLALKQLQFNPLTTEIKAEDRVESRATLGISPYDEDHPTANSTFNISLRLNSDDTDTVSVLSLVHWRWMVPTECVADSCVIKNLKMSVVEICVDLRGRSINDDVIRNHTVQLVPELWGVNGTAVSPVLLPSQDIVIIDNRRLRVGFDGDRGYDGETVFLNVAALEATHKLEKDLLLNVALYTDTDKIGDTLVSIPSGDTSLHEAAFDVVVDPALSFIANLSVADNNSELSMYVQIDRPTVVVTQSRRDKELRKLTQQYSELVNKYKEVSRISNETKKEIATLKKRFRLVNATTSTHTNSSFHTDVTSTTATTDVTSTTATTDVTSTTATTDVTSTTATTDVTSTTATTDVTSTTVNTTTDTDATSVNATTDVTSTNVTTNVTSANATTNLTSVNIPIAGALCEDGNCVSDESNYMWWIFVGFAILLMVAVTSYLLFNHRAKVKVYLVSMWKSTDSMPATSSKKSGSRKYTALPTSIHDSLTHED